MVWAITATAPNSHLCMIMYAGVTVVGQALACILILTLMNVNSVLMLCRAVKNAHWRMKRSWFVTPVKILMCKLKAFVLRLHVPSG